MSTVQRLNLAAPIRTALIGAPDITALLSTWQGEPAVFTRRPTWGDVELPAAVINPDLPMGNQDFIDTKIALVTRDIAYYGEQKDDYRAVEDLAYLTRELFHRNKTVIASPDFHLIDCVCAGPFVAPVDDDQHVARIVSPTFRIQLLSG